MTFSIISSPDVSYTLQEYQKMFRKFKRQTRIAFDYPDAMKPRHRDPYQKSKQWFAPIPVYLNNGLDDKLRQCARAAEEQLQLNEKEMKAQITSAMNKFDSIINL